MHLGFSRFFKRTHSYIFFHLYILIVRNDKVFNDWDPSSESVISKAVAATLDFASCFPDIDQSIVDDVVPGPSQPLWSDPCLGALKLIVIELSLINSNFVWQPLLLEIAQVPC